MKMMLLAESVLVRRNLAQHSQPKSTPLSIRSSYKELLRPCRAGSTSSTIADVQLLHPPRRPPAPCQSPTSNASASASSHSCSSYASSSPAPCRPPSPVDSRRISKQESISQAAAWTRRSSSSLQKKSDLSLVAKVLCRVLREVGSIATEEVESASGGTKLLDLFPAIPLAVAANCFKPWLFVLSLLSLIPLVERISFLTEISQGGYMGERDFVDKDRLILRGLLFHGYHGVKQEEKKLGQKFLADVDAWLDLSKACESDDINDTVSYAAIYRIAKKIVEGSSKNLLESVAQQIANSIFLDFPQISAVRVKIGKPHVAVPGTIDHLGVEITRFNKHGNSSKSAV